MACLTPEAFAVAAARALEVLPPEWTLVQSGESFHLRRDPIHKPAMIFTAKLEQDDASSDWIDPSILTDNDIVPERPQTTLEWNISVVFSETWRCPALYLHVQDASGQPVPHTELGLTEDFSYEEHPVTGLPSLSLHPCRTNDVLDAVRKGATPSSNPAVELLTWMSIALSSIGSSLPPKAYLQALKEA